MSTWYKLVTLVNLLFDPHELVVDLCANEQQLTEPLIYSFGRREERKEGATSEMVTFHSRPLFMHRAFGNTIEWKQQMTVDE